MNRRWRITILLVAAILGHAPAWSQANGGGVCIQVVTPAADPVSGSCREFPTPCDVPVGWMPVATCPATALPDYNGIWALRTAVATNLRYIFLRQINSRVVLTFLNAGSWDAFITDLTNGRISVTTWDAAGFNQWSLVFDSATHGTIIGERCVASNVIYPLIDGGQTGTPTVSSDDPSAPTIIPYGNCRIPEGSRLTVEKIF
jgi:hypothetical protein